MCPEMFVVKISQIRQDDVHVDEEGVGSDQREAAVDKLSHAIFRINELTAAKDTEGVAPPLTGGGLAREPEPAHLRGPQGVSLRA